MSVSWQAQDSLQEAGARALASLEGCGFTREFALLLHCVRPLHNEADRQQITALLEAGLDWAYLLESADHHGEVPIVYQRLAEAKHHWLVRAESWALLEHHFHNKNRHNLFLMGQLTAVLELLKAAAIPCVPFKGPA